MNRDYQKIKTISDYSVLDSPETIMQPPLRTPISPYMDQKVLRMLVRPKYHTQFFIPKELVYLKDTIMYLSAYDSYRTGIRNSWCYVTVRHGLVNSVTDDEWHFDGSSFRTDIIPERNYIWTDHTPTEYKTGKLRIPMDFDPIKHNLFTFAARQLEDEPIQVCEEKQWYLLSPFCLHRRPKLTDTNKYRTFYRICFTDIEGRDVNNTHNELLPTPFYGRDPVKTFRNNLVDYYV